MNIYLISQRKNIGYEVYDSAVVCAENEEKAKLIHPEDAYSNIPKWWENKNEYHAWTVPENIHVQLIGIADKSIKKKVICASYNAG